MLLNIKLFVSKIYSVIEPKVKFKGMGEAPQWSVIWRVAHLKIVQITIVMPIIGYAIIFNQWLIEHSSLIVGAMDEKLYFLYYGFCCLAIASILFNTVCPEVIRDNGQVKEYVASEYSIANGARMQFLLMEMYQLSLRTKFRFGEKYGKAVSNLFNLDLPRSLEDAEGDLQFAVIPLQATITETVYSEFFIANFDLQDDSKPIWRVIVFITLLIGLVLLAIPTLRTFTEISIKLLS